MEVSVRDVQIKYLFLCDVDAHHPHPESQIWQLWVLNSSICRIYEEKFK